MTTRSGGRYTNAPEVFTIADHIDAYLLGRAVSAAGIARNPGYRPPGDRPQPGGGGVVGAFISGQWDRYDECAEDRSLTLAAHQAPCQAETDQALGEQYVMGYLFGHDVVAVDLSYEPVPPPDNSLADLWAWGQGVHDGVTDARARK